MIDSCWTLDKLNLSSTWLDECITGLTLMRFPSTYLNAHFLFAYLKNPKLNCQNIENKMEYCKKCFFFLRWKSLQSFGKVCSKSGSKLLQCYIYRVRGTEIVLVWLLWFVLECDWCFEICPDKLYQWGKRTLVWLNWIKPQRCEKAFELVKNTCTNSVKYYMYTLNAHPWFCFPMVKVISFFFQTILTFFYIYRKDKNKNTTQTNKSGLSTHSPTVSVNY